MERRAQLLRTAFLAGAVTDALAVIPMLSPSMARLLWGFEDVDFCQRVHRAGLRVVYWPETSVVHAIGASARTVPSKAIIARQVDRGSPRGRRPP